MGAGGSMSSAVAWYRDHFQQIQATLPSAELPWLRNWRQQQLAQFLAQGFPTRRQENWRYTDLSLLEKQNFLLARNNEPFDKNFLANFLLKNTEHLQLVFINGYYQPALSQLFALPDGALLMSLAQALELCPQQVLPYLKHDFLQQPLAHLNTAFMTDGLFLYLPQQCVIKQPIHVLFLSTTPHPNMQHIRNIIIGDEQSQATIFEHYASLTDTYYWNNIVTQIHAGAAANIHYYKCQQESAQAVHSAQVNVQQQRDSQVYAWQAALGAHLAREDWQINLAEQNAATALHGWYSATAKQHLAQYIQINHCAPHTISRAFYKGLANDQATAVFNGKIGVQQTAPKTQAKLTNQNLLLANTATINTKPELEIYADDVQCAHGATIGQLDEEALFYLRTRGLDKIYAQQILLQAFAENSLEFIKTEIIKNFMSDLMQQKLSRLIEK
jgi:Fe-S cluster assembly protein SufD